MKLAIEPPDGFHWMDTPDGPKLMPGDYQPHEGAVERYEFEVIETHEEIEKPGPGKHSAEWDRIFEAILERTGDKQLAAATATARVGKADDPKTPAKPSERRSGSTRNPEGSAGATRGGIKLSEANVKTLEAKRDEHNERYGDTKSKKADLGALKAVFRRGAGAFSTSHRPSVQSRDQWAIARVNSFLYLLANGKPKSPKYVTDNDLLPESHPRSTRTKKRRPLFVVSTPTELDVVRSRHLCGPNGERFVKQFLEPIGLNRDEVDVVDLGEIESVDRSEVSVVVALGKAAKTILGETVDLHLPHPAAIRTISNTASLSKRLRSLSDAIEKEGRSYLPPKGVAEEAARGLEMRREHNRGGTEVGVARARDLANRRRVSEDTIRRMRSYFIRHEADLDSPANKNPSDPGYPGAGLIAWKLWGGSAGQRFAEKIYRQLEREETKKSVRVTKQDEAKRIVYGIVLDPYIVDAHDDHLSPAVIEETAHEWLKGSRVIGLDHDGEAEGATVVESWLHPYPTPEDYRNAVANKPHKAYATAFGDDMLRSGSWVLAVQLTPEQWAKVQAGELNAFSIGGHGRREDMTEAELPEVEFIEQT